MHVPAYLLLPAAAALVYTIASLLFKRGYQEGAGTLATFHWSNLIGMPVFLPLFFVHPGSLPLAEWWRPAFVAALMYTGTWLTFAAIRRGDVSMVTPILGTKVVFVALAVVAMTRGGLSTGLWLAAFLTTAGIFVIGRGDSRRGRANGPALFLCLCSSLIYGVTDVIISDWAVKFGGTSFLASLPQFLGFYSLLTLLGSKRGAIRLAPGALWWVIAAGILLNIQGMGMGVSLAFFNDPTGVNILYSTRGLWAIILVWGAGSWFANRERERAGRATMVFRLAGTLLITSGVVIAVVVRSS